MSDPLDLCLAGQISADIAVARLLLAGETPGTILRRVQAIETSSPSWCDLYTIVTARAGELERLRHMLDAAAVDHVAAASPAHIAALFDRAVAISPEGSVALYSLGDPAALHAATTEIVGWLARERLIRSSADVLDLGCGIGRVASALSPLVRSVIGVDVSEGMIAEARRRLRDRDNVSFTATAGTDLACCDDASIDLVLAVDSFPYLHQSGLAEFHVAEAARVLRPSGALVIFNLSYRGMPNADRDDAESWAARYGFSLPLNGASLFTAWDAATFLMVCPPAVSN